MPATTPPLGDLLASRLATLGAQLRARRKQLKVSATAAAESAGMSRVTWHRIERGEPSVTMGAWLGAIAALGLELALADPQQPSPEATAPPARIRVADYPQLRRLAWQLDEAAELTPQEALATYERNWRHVDVQALDERERALVQALASRWGGGRLLV